MRILFVAATSFEVESLKAAQESGIRNQDNSSLNTQYSILITGVGMVATAYALGRELALNTYDLAINLGIAGSFDRDILLGDIVEVTNDTFTELGAEDDQQFISINQLGFGEDTFEATGNLADIYRDDAPRQVTGITVNTVHGNEASIQKLQQRLNPQLESMEGAAFFYACQQAGVPSLQIRAVSNYIEKRNRDNWQIGLAVKNLNTFALDLIKEL